MTGRIVGIGFAVLVHLAVILFGGIFFMKPPAAQEKKKVEVVDLISEDAPDKASQKAEKEDDASEEAKKESEAPIEEPSEVPDLKGLEQLDAAAAAPALDAMSLSALEDSLDPGASGGAGFFTDSVDLGSGGRIGGTGKAIAAEMESIFSVSELDQKPRPIFQAPPSYPLELRRRKVEGSVYVLFVVNDDGRVLDPRIEKSTNPEFDAPALQAVRQWKFEPGVRNGRKVRFKMRVPLRFAAGQGS